MRTYSPEATNQREYSEYEADLDFATRAVVYLEKRGLDEDEVVDCLMHEFDFDRETARELASLAA
jgi:hypothetical protein